MLYVVRCLHDSHVINGDVRGNLRDGGRENLVFKARAEPGENVRVVQELMAYRLPACAALGVVSVVW